MPAAQGGAWARLARRRTRLRGVLPAVIAAATCGWPLASPADILLSTPQAELAAGAPLVVQVTATNPDSSPRTLALPASLQLQIEADGRTRAVELVRAGGEDPATEFALAPGEFRTVRYTGQIPRGFTGPLILTTENLASTPLLLHVGTSSSSEPPPLAVSVYEPVYFIVGGDGGFNAKFQISFRYRLFNSRGALAQRLPLLDNLYLGYSQTSLWDLDELSAPFRDSSYRPRLFFADYDMAGSQDGRWHFGIEAGIGHESNGRSGEDSRSLNSLYARPTLLFGEPLGRRFYLAPVLYSYVGADKHDLYRYRGYVDWVIGYGSKSSWNFWTTLRRGTEYSGNLELNLSYPLSRRSGGNLSGWVLLQYFDGYGESPLDYNRKLPSQLRLGLAIAL